MMKQSNTIKGRLFRIQEAAAYTGLAIDTLYKMVSQGRVTYIKLGGALRFDPVQLDEWIKQNTKMPMPEKRY